MTTLVTNCQKMILLAITILAVTPTKCIAQPHENLWVITSPDERRTPTSEHLRQCLTQLAQEWKVPIENLPPILIFHVSSNVAETADVRGTLVLRKNSFQQQQWYFEIWIVGDQPLMQYILALQNVLEHTFHLAPRDEQRQEVLTRVGRVQNAIIDVREGK